MSQSHEQGLAAAGGVLGSAALRNGWRDGTIYLCVLGFSWGSHWGAEDHVKLLRSRSKASLDNRCLQINTSIHIADPSTEWTEAPTTVSERKAIGSACFDSLTERGKQNF